ncbi:MAG: TlpA family protein disulfide reductase [Frankiaceae bacterium]|nr:TlpA family protein disulfide reductase [Frankiaceae bacterium]
MKRLLVLSLVAAMAAGCSSSGGGTDHAINPYPQLVKQANLDACPKSSTNAVPGGLPDLTLDCLAPGDPVHLAGLVGKPTVVNIWGSWCEPCQAEEKYLSAAYRSVKGKVRFLGVDTVDSANSALDFGAHVSPPVRFPSVVDPDKKLLTALLRQGPPYSVFVDASGKVVGKHGGSPYRSTAEVEADINRYLHVTA